MRSAALRTRTGSITRPLSPCERQSSCSLEVAEQLSEGQTDNSLNSKMDITTAAVVLAAGEGKRMVSDIPQVMLSWSSSSSRLCLIQTQLFKAFLLVAMTAAYFTACPAHLIQPPRLQVLHKVAETPLVCHAVNMALGRGWSPLVVVVNPQNAAAVKEVGPACCCCISPWQAMKEKSQVGLHCTAGHRQELS